MPNMKEIGPVVSEEKRLEKIVDEDADEDAAGPCK